MLLRMGLLLRLGPNVITDGTFITLGSSYYTCAFYNILKEGHILFWFGFNIKDSLSTTVLCLMQVKAFSAYSKFKNFILCGCSVYRVTSQPFSLTYLYSMVQNLKCTCNSKINTPLQVVFSTLFSVIDLWSNTVSCLISYLKYFLFKDVFKRHFGDQNNVLIKK